MHIPETTTASYLYDSTTAMQGFFAAELTSRQRRLQRLPLEMAGLGDLKNTFFDQPSADAVMQSPMFGA